MENLHKLRETLYELNLLDRQIPLRERYYNAIQNPCVREILDLEIPLVTDLTDILEIEKGGKVYAVRMDLNKGVDNHKKPVVAGLILRGILRGRIPKEGIDTLIDSGNFNSAKAIRFYADRFGMKGIYIMSRLFPQHIIDLIESDNFKVIRAPHRYDNAREREFYEYLFELMQNRDFRKNKFCLWHAKYGGEVMYPIGRDISANFEEVPDYVVSCIGAGSTLEGFQISMQDYFRERNVKKIPQIVLAEHELSPLFVKFLPIRFAVSKPMSLEDVTIEDYYYKPESVPHMVLGPHYDEINPLLSKESIDRIESVIQYSENDWKEMQQFLSSKGLNIGNSSAANLSASVRLANEGYKVATVIFEPFREFYKQQENETDIPWIFRYETLPQKVAACAAGIGYTAAGIYYMLNINPNTPSFPF